MLTAEQLEQHIRSGIPLANKMAFQVRELGANSIIVVGGGSENINVHGTAFAGSLYTICTLALWGLVYSRLPAGADLVLADASIRYRQPVIGDIVARCDIESAEMDRFLARIEARGSAFLPAAVVEVPAEDGVAVEYQGKMHARLARD
jgi:thioesterase domain-containing protein